MNDDTYRGESRSEEVSDAARRLAVQGFVALWRGEQPPAAGLVTGGADAVGELTALGRIEVDGDGRLVAVHGLVRRPTAHRIEHSGVAVNTWCALDAIGIPAALGIDALVVTGCPTCGTELTVEMVGGVPADGAAYRLWIPGGQCNHLVEDFCRHANLYCNDGHLASGRPPAGGEAVTVVDAASMGRRMWHDVAAAARGWD